MHIEKLLYLSKYLLGKGHTKIKYFCNITMPHEYFMQRCLQLAQLGAANVAPNPMVGCVIVVDGKIIGEDIALGTLLGNKDIGKVDANLKINGKGFNINEADINLDGNLDNLEIKQNHKNVGTSCWLKSFYMYSSKINCEHSKILRNFKVFF